MRTIATMQFKGGVGKSTSIFALASAAVDQGSRVLLIDSDQNAPMAEWRASSQALGNWSDLIDVEEILDFDELYKQLIAYDDANKYDFVFVDPRAGRTEFGLLLAQTVDAILLPVGPEKVEADGLRKTLSVFREEARNGAMLAPYRALFSNIKSDSKLSASMIGYRDMLLSEAKFMKTRLHDRVAYKNMQTFGPIGGIISAHLESSNALERHHAQHYKIALREAKDLLEETIQLMEGESDG